MPQPLPKLLPSIENKGEGCSSSETFSYQLNAVRENLEASLSHTRTYMHA